VLGKVIGLMDADNPTAALNLGFDLRNISILDRIISSENPRILKDFRVPLFFYYEDNGRRV
jgi:hypothetical protein